MAVKAYAGRILRDLDARRRRLLAAALVTMTAGAVLKALTPVVLGVAIDHMLIGHGGSVYLPFAVVGVLLLAGQVLDVVRRQLVENVATAFECDNRTRAYAHLLRLPLAMLGEHQVGALQGNANRAVEGCAKLLKLLAGDLLPALVGSVAAVSVALVKDPLIGLVMVMVIPTGFLLTRWQVTDQAGVRVRIRGIKDTIDGRVGGQLPMIEAIRSAGAEAHFDAQTTTACRELRAIEYRHHRAMARFDALKAANEGLWQMLALGAAVYASGGGLAAVGDVTTYALLYAGILGPLREMHRIVDEASESAQQAADFYRLLDTPRDPAYAEQQTRAAATPDGAAAVELRGVAYHHAGAGRTVLDGLDLMVAPGERVGIVGRTGCGKSTLLRLLRRIYHGYAGAIALGGDDLGTLSHAELSARVAYVTQTAQIVHGTVEENLRFGDEDATFDDVVDAARRAQIHDEIMAMPGGYGFHLAERGENLSGGQRQRICIARALLRRPQLLLLDEPTSALDPASERAVQRTIDALSDVTVLIVAHRLQSLQSTDRIVVLEGGRVAEQGPYATLAALPGGRFAAMLAAADDGDDGDAVVHAVAA